MKFKLINVIRKDYSLNQFLDRYGIRGSRILNVGCGLKTIADCINFDIRKEHGVNIIGDAHSLPFKSSAFDVCILSAVLQYCRNPFRVADEIYRVLKHEGYVYIDAPFVQPLCPGTPDLFRFTREGLEVIFAEKFKVVDIDVSISGGSALAFYCQALVGNTNSRYINFVLKFIVSILLSPIAITRYNKRKNVAGAFYLIAQK